MVPNTSELLPEPEMPVNTVSRRFGISTLTSLRLFTRAPCTRIRSWLSAACTAAHLSGRAPRTWRGRARRPALLGGSIATVTAVTAAVTSASAVAAGVLVGVAGLAGLGGGGVDAVVVAPEDVVQV